MNQKTEELLERTFNFGVDCILFLETIPDDKILGAVKFQLAKAATSVGANYEESQSSESNKDFIHKIAIVSKETRESNYWFRILNALLSETYKNGKFIHLLTESSELKKIFISIKMTAEQNYKRKKQFHQPSPINHQP